MSAGHTPGPWRVQPYFLTVYTTSDPANGLGGTLAIAKPLDGNGLFSAEQVAANANLIGAAPDLLAAAHAALPWLGGLVNENQSVAPEYAQLCTAIAKATAA